MGKAELESMLIPGTDAEVAGRYGTLAERARDATFGLDEPEVVIMDTETTGLDTDNDELIQIAAAIMKGPDILERWSTFVDPGCPIPPEITELTGITQDMVDGAPTPREAVAAFAAFAADRDIIAHNADFDQTFIMRYADKRALGSSSVSERAFQRAALPGDWIDSVELARISLPRVTAHRLGALAAAFDTGTPNHRADDDVEALCGVWRVLLVGLTDLPEGLVGFIAKLFPEVDWPLRKVLSHIAAATPDAKFSLRVCRRDLVSSGQTMEKDDAHETIGPGALFPTEREITEAFAPGGLVTDIYPDFEPRPEQVDMACAVTRAFSEFGYCAVEAGTGVGKSMAYLLPAVLAAQRLNIGIGIATKTNALMDQLVFHELPRLSAKLPGGVNYAALKGYEHYPCLRKMQRFANDDPSSDPDRAREELVMLATVYAFVAQTSWGDLDLVNLYWRNLPRESIAASAADCLKRDCPFYNAGCLLHGQRRAARGADIVVTNHALLFRDVMADGGILPPIRFWIIDEAHAAEAEARKQLSPVVRGRDLIDTLYTLGISKHSQLNAVRQLAHKHKEGSMLQALADTAKEQVHTVEAIATSFFSFVHDLGDDRSPSGYEREDLWVNEEVRAGGKWGVVVSSGSGLCDKAGALIDTLRDIQELIGPGAGQEGDVRMALEGSICTLMEVREALALILDGEDSDYAYAARIYKNPDRQAEELSALMLDVGAKLVDDFYPRLMGIVYTSATIATGQSFAHFEHAVGLDRLDDEANLETMCLASGYDYDENMCVVVPTDMPGPNDRGYLPALVKLLRDVHVAVGGSTLTLFTNRREMELAYEKLRDELADEGIKLICQLRGISSKRLRDEFLADEKTCLFALRSFWEGFDAPGDTLRCVVVPKLPFSRPDDPLSRERELRDANAWGHYSLPEAIISLKQAAGRLIRSSGDSGFLVLGDSRLVTKRYGRAFLEALPSKNQLLLDTDSVCRAIEDRRF